MIIRENVNKCTKCIAYKSEHCWMIIITTMLIVILNYSIFPILPSLLKMLFQVKKTALTYNKETVKY